MKKLPALLLVACLAGCSEPPKPVEPPKVVEPPKPVAQPPKPARPNMAPPLSEAQRAEMTKVFNAAREKVKEARVLKKKGDELLKTGGAPAANDTYVQAKDLFKEATEMTEDWIEPDLGKVTAAQVKDYLESFNSERGGWIKESSDMGKLHK